MKIHISGLAEAIRLPVRFTHVVSVVETSLVVAYQVDPHTFLAAARNSRRTRRVE
jgi:hypothetical protein